MADVCVKDLFDLKMLEAIDYIKCVGKKKPTKERVLKHMARSNLELLEEVLQMLKSRKRKHSRKSWRSFISLSLFKRIYKSHAKKREKEGGNID